jgi:hypothetical protein
LSHSDVEIVNHVWKLNDTIWIDTLSSCRLSYDCEDSFLSRKERRTLKKLIQILKCRRLAARCKRLIEKLETYLWQNLKDEFSSFFKIYKNTMTRAIVDVMRKEKTLSLTSLVNRFQQKQFEWRCNFIDELEDFANYNNYEEEDDYDDDYLEISIVSHQDRIVMHISLHHHVSRQNNFEILTNTFFWKFINNIQQRKIFHNCSLKDDSTNYASLTNIADARWYFSDRTILQCKLSLRMSKKWNFQRWFLVHDSHDCSRKNESDHCLDKAFLTLDYHLTRLWTWVCHKLLQSL